MPFISIAGSGEDTSRFFHWHQNMAHNWETFAQNHGFATSGNYNAYGLDLKMVSETDTFAAEILTTHQLKNVQNGLIPRKGVYFKQTKIQLTFPPGDEFYLRLEKGSLFKSKRNSLKLSHGYRAWTNGNEKFAQIFQFQGMGKQLFAERSLKIYLDRAQGQISLRFFGFWGGVSKIGSLRYFVLHAADLPTPPNP
ncbi:MAG: hypothetical protein H6581_14165 [Bacteroidia bacterium]|nr:hypothetical protein [Bacteroidia bacterium]